MIDEIISHYKISEKLGEGGMGVVYKAEDLKLKRTVALKFLPSSFSFDEEAKQRFIHEAQSASALDHTNICTVYEINETEEEKSFIAMAYYEGETLKDKIEKGTIEQEEAVKIILQIAEGLKAAHEKGIIHRDIKPANIFITNKGIVKILDFGLAKSSGRTQLTQLGTTMGTCNYMSPEQARGEEVDQGTDIWALGVVMYEMLTGTLPFYADYDQAIIYSILNENPDLSEISEKLKSILKKALAKDSGERYQKVEELIFDLTPEQSTQTSQSHHTFVLVSSSLKLKTKILFAAVFIVVLALIALYYFTKNQISNDSKPIQTDIQQKSQTSLAVMYFENLPDPEDKEHTGDMLTNLLITSLSQIKGIDVISRERLLDIQKEFGRADTKTLSPSYAEQVAQKANINTMLIGSIIQIKPKLAVTTRLIDVKTGKIINSCKVTKFSAGQIFNLVDSLSNMLQPNFQVASASHVKIKPVSEVTTNSPEAYRAYTAGVELFNKNYFPEARAAFARAVELDSNFAMAYSRLSWFTGDPEKKWDLLQKAVKLSTHTTERERLQILASNYSLHNNPLKAAEMWKKLVERYPHETRPYELLAQIYKNEMLQPEKGAEILKLGIKNNPSAKHLMNNLAYFLLFLNRKQEALNMVNEYIKLAPAEPNPYDTKGDIYASYMQYDSSLIAYKKSFNLRESFSAPNLAKFEILRSNYEEAKQYINIMGYGGYYIEVHKGQFNKVLNEFKTFLNSHQDNLQLLYEIIPLNCETGQYPEMLNSAEKFSAILNKDPSSKFYGRTYIAWALAKNGQSEEAHKMLNNMRNATAGGSPIEKVVLDYTSAVIYFEEKNYSLALQKFKKVFALIPPNHWPSIYYAVSLLKCGEISSSIELLKSLVFCPFYGLELGSIPGNMEYWPIPAVKAHYWLGVAYEKQGKINKAVKEYKKFIKIWKDADFNSPELTDANERLLKFKRIIKD